MNRSRGKGNHQEKQGYHEHDREYDRNPIEIALDDTGSRVGAVNAAGDDLGNARALARMHEHEDDEPDCRNRPEDKDDVHKRRRVHHIEYRVHELPFFLTYAMRNAHHRLDILTVPIRGSTVNFPSIARACRFRVNR